MGRTRRTRRRERNRQPDSTLLKVPQPIMKAPIYELADAQAVEQIHNTALDLLEEIGIDFIDDKAVEILKAHGVKVGGETGYTAYFDRDMVMEYVAKAPSIYKQQARNSERNVMIGGRYACFAPVYGPPFVRDRDRGRREATLEDFTNFVKLVYQMPYLHSSGGTLMEPMDEPNHTRHLDMLYAHIKYSDKPFMGSVTSAANAQDSAEICKLLLGDRYAETACMTSLINVSSPRRYDDRMLGALMVYAREMQGMIISPFLISGAMGPVSVAGTAIQAHMEVLSGVAFAQMVQAGAPCIYGVFNASIDLKSGAPVFGSAEAAATTYVSGQMARHVGLPYRSAGNFASSKVADTQAAYESVMAMTPGILANANFVLHAAGWLEGGLASGYEKLVLDHEALAYHCRFMEGLDMSDNGLALDALREVAPGGHHLGTAHTMANYRTAFVRSDMFDYNSYEQWLEEGEVTAEQQANKKWKQMLKDYEAPALDPAIDEAIQAYMTKRKSEIEPEY